MKMSEQTQEKSESEKETKFSVAIKNVLMMLSIASLLITLGTQCAKTRTQPDASPQLCVICDPPCTGNTRCNSSNGTCEGVATDAAQDATVSAPDAKAAGTPTTNRDFYILQIAIPRQIH